MALPAEWLRKNLRYWFVWPPVNLSPANPITDVLAVKCSCDSSEVLMKKKPDAQSGQVRGDKNSPLPDYIHNLIDVHIVAQG